MHLVYVDGRVNSFLVFQYSINQNTFYSKIMLVFIHQFIRFCISIWIFFSLNKWATILLYSRLFDLHLSFLIYFCYFQLAFRSVQTTLASVKSQMKRILCMPEDISHNAPAKEVDNVILTYLRKTVDQFDLSANLTVGISF